MLPYGFQDYFSISVKNAIVILMEIALNLEISFGKMDILTVLILTIHEHILSFYHWIQSPKTWSSYNTGISLAWLDLHHGILQYLG